MGLLLASPNPFDAGTAITFWLDAPSGVSAVVYDAAGRAVRVLSRGERHDAGVQRLRWDGRTDAGHEAPAGVYFVRVETPDATSTAKIVRTR